MRGPVWQRLLRDQGIASGIRRGDHVIRGNNIADCCQGNNGPILSGSRLTANTSVSTIHLIEGPVGAGKSTFAGKLSLTHSAPHLDLDQWMVTLFSPDRPEDGFMEWYAECKARCITQIWAVACEILDAGSPVVLELGLVSRADREAFYHRVRGTDHPLKVYVLDAPLEVRRARVRDRNQQQSSTYKMPVSDEVFDLANGFWEAPTKAEQRDLNLEIVATA